MCSRPPSLFGPTFLLIFALLLLLHQPLPIRSLASVLISSPFDNFRIECPQASGAQRLGIRMVESQGQKRQDTVFVLSCQHIVELYPWLTMPDKVAEQEREDCHYTQQFDILLDQQLRWSCREREYLAGIARLSDTRIQLECCRLRTRTEASCIEVEYVKPIGSGARVEIEYQAKLINALSINGDQIKVRFCDLTPREMDHIMADAGTALRTTTIAPTRATTTAGSVAAFRVPFGQASPALLNDPRSVNKQKASHENTQQHQQLPPTIEEPNEPPPPEALLVDEVQQQPVMEEPARDMKFVNSDLEPDHSEGRNSEGRALAHGVNLQQRQQEVQAVQPQNQQPQQVGGVQQNQQPEIQAVQPGMEQKQRGVQAVQPQNQQPQQHQIGAVQPDHQRQEVQAVQQPVTERSRVEAVHVGAVQPGQEQKQQVGAVQQHQIGAIQGDQQPEAEAIQPREQQQGTQTVQTQIQQQQQAGAVQIEQKQQQAEAVQAGVIHAGAADQVGAVQPEQKTEVRAVQSMVTQQQQQQQQVGAVQDGDVQAGVVQPGQQPEAETVQRAEGQQQQVQAVPVTEQPKASDAVHVGAVQTGQERQVQQQQRDQQEDRVGRERVPAVQAVQHVDQPVRTISFGRENEMQKTEQPESGGQRAQEVQQQREIQAVKPRIKVYDQNFRTIHYGRQAEQADQKTDQNRGIHDQVDRTDRADQKPVVDPKASTHREEDDQREERPTESGDQMTTTPSDQMDQEDQSDQSDQKGQNDQGTQSDQTDQGDQMHQGDQSGQNDQKNPMIDQADQKQQKVPDQADQNATEHPGDQPEEDPKEVLREDQAVHPFSPTTTTFETLTTEPSLTTRSTIKSNLLLRRKGMHEFTVTLMPHRLGEPITPGIGTDRQRQRAELAIQKQVDAIRALEREIQVKGIAFGAANQQIPEEHAGAGKTEQKEQSAGQNQTSDQGFWVAQRKKPLGLLRDSDQNSETDQRQSEQKQREEADQGVQSSSTDQGGKIGQKEADITEQADEHQAGIISKANADQSDQKGAPTDQNGQADQKGKEDGQGSDQSIKSAQMDREETERAEQSDQQDQQADQQSHADHQGQADQPDQLSIGSDQLTTSNPSSNNSDGEAMHRILFGEPAQADLRPIAVTDQRDQQHQLDAAKSLKPIQIRKLANATNPAGKVQTIQLLDNENKGGKAASVQTIQWGKSTDQSQNDQSQSDQSKISDQNRAIAGVVEKKKEPSAEMDKEDVITTSQSPQVRADQGQLVVKPGKSEDQVDQINRSDRPTTQGEETIRIQQAQTEIPSKTVTNPSVEGQSSADQQQQQSTSADQSQIVDQSQMKDQNQGKEQGNTKEGNGKVEGKEENGQRHGPELGPESMSKPDQSADQSTDEAGLAITTEATETTTNRGEKGMDKNNNANNDDGQIGIQINDELDLQHQRNQQQQPKSLMANQSEEAQQDRPESPSQSGQNSQNFSDSFEPHGIAGSNKKRLRIFTIPLEQQKQQNRSSEPGELFKPVMVPTEHENPIGGEEANSNNNEEKIKAIRKGLPIYSIDFKQQQQHRQNVLLGRNIDPTAASEEVKPADKSVETMFPLQLDEGQRTRKELENVREASAELLHSLAGMVEHRQRARKIIDKVKETTGLGRSTKPPSSQEFAETMFREIEEHEKSAKEMLSELDAIGGRRTVTAGNAMNTSLTQLPSPTRPATDEPAPQFTSPQPLASNLSRFLFSEDADNQHHEEVEDISVEKSSPVDMTEGQNEEINKMHSSNNSSIFTATIVEPEEQAQNSTTTTISPQTSTTIPTTTAKTTDEKQMEEAVKNAEENKGKEEEEEEEYEDVEEGEKEEGQMMMKNSTESPNKGPSTGTTAIGEETAKNEENEKKPSTEAIAETSRPKIAEKEDSLKNEQNANGTEESSASQLAESNLAKAKAAKTFVELDRPKGEMRKSPPRRKLQLEGGRSEEQRQKEDEEEKTDEDEAAEEQTTEPPLSASDLPPLDAFPTPPPSSNRATAPPALAQLAQLPAKIEDHGRKSSGKAQQQFGARTLTAEKWKSSSSSKVTTTDAMDYEVAEDEDKGEKKKPEEEEGKKLEEEGKKTEEKKSEDEKMEEKRSEEKRSEENRSEEEDKDQENDHPKERTTSDDTDETPEAPTTITTTTQATTTTRRRHSQYSSTSSTTRVPLYKRRQLDRVALQVFGPAAFDPESERVFPAPRRPIGRPRGHHFQPSPNSPQGLGQGQQSGQAGGGGPNGPSGLPDEETDQSPFDAERALLLKRLRQQHRVPIDEQEAEENSVENEASIKPQQNGQAETTATIVDRPRLRGRFDRVQPGSGRFEQQQKEQQSRSQLEPGRSPFDGADDESRAEQQRRLAEIRRKPSLAPASPEQKFADSEAKPIVAPPVSVDGQKRTHRDGTRMFAPKDNLPMEMPTRNDFVGRDPMPPRQRIDNKKQPTTATTAVEPAIGEGNDIKEDEAEKIVDQDILVPMNDGISSSTVIQQQEETTITGRTTTITPSTILTTEQIISSSTTPTATIGQGQQQQSLQQVQSQPQQKQHQQRQKAAPVDHYWSFWTSSPAEGSNREEEPATGASTTPNPFYNASKYFRMPSQQQQRRRAQQTENVLTFCSKAAAVRDSSNLPIACAGEDGQVWSPPRCPPGTGCLPAADSAFYICCPVGGTGRR